MARRQSSDSDLTKVSSACSKCGAPLRLVRIVPDKQQHEVHTAKCDACGEEVNSVMPIR